MTTKNNGGPAFPIPTGQSEHSWHEWNACQFGMTLRDYFAAKAMPAIIGSRAGVSLDIDEFMKNVACISYAMADAMLKARGE